MEYIITNLAVKEEQILIDNDIEWYPDTLDTRDVIIDGNKEYLDRVLKLIGRK